MLPNGSDYAAEPADLAVRVVEAGGERGDLSLLSRHNLGDGLRLTPLAPPSVPGHQQDPEPDPDEAGEQGAGDLRAAHGATSSPAQRSQASAFAHSSDPFLFRHFTDGP